MFLQFLYHQEASKSELLHSIDKKRKKLQLWILEKLVVLIKFYLVKAFHLGLGMPYQLRMGLHIQKKRSPVKMLIQKVLAKLVTFDTLVTESLIRLNERTSPKAVTNSFTFSSVRWAGRPPIKILFGLILNLVLHMRSHKL